MQANNGTIAIRVGSTSVTGTGTTFLTDAAPGKYLCVPGLTQVFQIAEVLSDTMLTMTTAPKGQSVGMPVPGGITTSAMGIYGLVYSIIESFTPVIGLALPTGQQIAAQTRIINRNWKILDREIPPSA